MNAMQALKDLREIDSAGEWSADEYRMLLKPLFEGFGSGKPLVGYVGNTMYSKSIPCPPYRGMEDALATNNIAAIQDSIRAFLARCDANLGIASSEAAAERNDKLDMMSAIASGQETILRHWTRG